MVAEYSTSLSPLHLYFSNQFEGKPPCIVVDNAKTHDDLRRFDRFTHSSFASSCSSSSHHRRLSASSSGRPPLHTNGSSSSNGCRWTSGTRGNEPNGGSSSNSAAPVVGVSGGTAMHASQPSASSTSSPSSSGIPAPSNGSHSSHNSSSSSAVSVPPPPADASPSATPKKDSPTMPTRKNTPPQHVLSAIAGKRYNSHMPSIPIRKKTPPQHKLQSMVDREQMSKNPPPAMTLEIVSNHSTQSSRSSPSAAPSPRRMQHYTTIDGGFDNDNDSISYQSSLYSSGTSVSMFSQTSSKLTIDSQASSVVPTSTHSNSNNACKQELSNSSHDMPLLVSSAPSRSGRKRSPPPSTNRTAKSMLSVQQALGMAKQRCADVGMAEELRQLVVQAIEVAEEEAMSMRSARRSIDSTLEGMAGVLLDDDSTIDPRSMGLEKLRTGLSRNNSAQMQ
eukprot:CAMPEP_0119557150 /NCGR_PEP_ID=MMETSP1352-20130426/8905_1 /TAXON_ID=265584 /ORGANISM="Stauroneis constricta, Strain CCMP1120" /LENGTH=446 /DNA_ID=CAMNT_0007604203 /DNA_START=258 /DNA_END=1598 /DNA_ORIENTATION=+